MAENDQESRDRSGSRGTEKPRRGRRRPLEGGPHAHDFPEGEEGSNLSKKKEGEGGGEPHHPDPDDDES